MINQISITSLQNQLRSEIISWYKSNQIHAHEFCIEWHMFKLINVKNNYPKQLNNAPRVSDATCKQAIQNRWYQFMLLTCLFSLKQHLYRKPLLQV